MSSSSRDFNPPGMLDLDGLRCRLKCSRRHVYRLLDAGLLPKPLRLGKLVRWDSTAIEAWINQGCPPMDGSGKGQEGQTNART